MNNALKIVHVLTSLSVGGGERMALLLATEQKRRGHHVSVISLEAPERNGPLTEEFEEAGITVVKVPKRPHGLDPTLSARILGRLLRHRSDVVHTHNPLPLIYAAAPGRIARARVVHTEHGSHDGSPRVLVLRRAAGWATHRFVAVSDATAQFVRGLRGAPEGRLDVILNATNLSRFARTDAQRTRSRSAWGADDGTFVIGTVGRMAPVKNHELLLRAAAPLLSGACLLVFVGDGESRSETTKLATSLGVVENCRFLGEIRDVPAALSGFDLFALSSHSEGLPMALAEAMGASLPVVATAVGGVPKVVVDEDTGYLVPAGDRDAMEARFRQLAEDRAHASALGARGLTVASSRYSLDRMVDEYLDAYTAS